MKCQNCGKNEVNFHYSSNINGCLTETNLCSECASKSGYDVGSFFDTSSIFDGFFPMFNSPGEFWPMRMPLPFRMPMLSFGPAFPFVLRPQLGVTAQNEEGARSEEKTATEAPAAEVDQEINKRREVNMLREQMRSAAESDDFEKAIELREKIKGMEANG